MAGDAGVQWGLDFHYQNYDNSDSNTNNTAGKSSVLGARIGIITGDLSAYVDFGLGNTAENAAGTTKLESKGSHDVGITYASEDVNYMAVSNSTSYEIGAAKYETSLLKVGAAKTYRLNDKANMWISGFYSIATSDQNGTEEDRTTVPVAVALEVSAKDWLIVRGSVGQNVFINDNDDGTNTGSNADTTMVNAGVSLVYGDLSIDGSIGNDPAVSGTGVSGQDSLGRFSMTYKF